MNFVYLKYILYIQYMYLFVRMENIIWIEIQILHVNIFLYLIVYKITQWMICDVIYIPIRIRLFVLFLLQYHRIVYFMYICIYSCIGITRFVENKFDLFYRPSVINCIYLGYRYHKPYHMIHIHMFW